ncbi:MAG: hypothetical protein JEZ06_12160 [Anaerolineaceae bacterium]|nr:hypothetical protein [Anaerolineaceae bacterium]
MSKFIAILKNRRNGELSTELLNQHVEHLIKLSKNKKLVLCGPFKTSDGAIQILEASTLNEAMELVHSDPFIKSKYYADFDLDELVEANDSNNFLLSKTEEKIDKRKHQSEL